MRCCSSQAHETNSSHVLSPCLVTVLHESLLKRWLHMTGGSEAVAVATRYGELMRTNQDALNRANLAPMWASLLALAHQPRQPAGQVSAELAAKQKEVAVLQHQVQRQAQRASRYKERVHLLQVCPCRSAVSRLQLSSTGWCRSRQNVTRPCGRNARLFTSCALTSVANTNNLHQHCLCWGSECRQNVLWMSTQGLLPHSPSRKAAHKVLCSGLSPKAGIKQCHGEGDMTCCANTGWAGSPAPANYCTRGRSRGGGSST